MFTIPGIDLSEWVCEMFITDDNRDIPISKNETFEPIL